MLVNCTHMYHTQRLHTEPGDSVFSVYDFLKCLETVREPE